MSDIYIFGRHGVNNKPRYNRDLIYIGVTTEKVKCTNTDSRVVSE